MAIDSVKEEKKFLKGLAVSMFNTQYGKNILVDECSIVSIRPNYGASLGYEISTMVLNDHLRLRVYFSMGPSDSLQKFRLEVDESFINRKLGDEVHVAIGVLNRGWVEQGIYKFRWIAMDISSLNALQLMSGEPINAMDGGVLEYVV